MAPTVYVIDPTRHTFLVDDRAVLALKLLAAQSLDDPIPLPGGGGTGSGTNGGGTNTYYFAPMYTNGLWLDITSAGAGLACLDLHGGTDTVYAIWCATSPPGPWNVEAEVWPTNQDIMPFTLQMRDRPALLARAEDWTGVDSNGDGVPDWWMWMYFGNLALNATNLDSQGLNTLGYDFANGLDPNVISFSIAVSNTFVATSHPPLHLTITAGTPSSYSLLVDSTNFAAAAWAPYTSSTIVPDLGATGGWHELWLALRGRPSTAQPTWVWTRLKLLLTPPQITLSGPTNSTVSTSLIQLTGYSSEALSSITYDLSNALGTATSQQAVITGQAYSTNTAEFTTNYFQCYDVPLASGLNTITLHAVDLAGNPGSLITNISYCAPTNPPDLTLLWPQDGMQISGASFTIQGRVDDPSATVSLASMDSDGNTNYLSGVTGRDGIFCVENVPLSSGTNWLALTLTTPGGDTLTNFTIVQSTVAFSISPVQAGDTNANGTIGTNGYTIWVNGAQATQDSGTWTAPIAPIGVGGGIVVAEAISDADTNDVLYAQAIVDPPQGVFVSAFHYNYYGQFTFDGWPWSQYDILDWQDGQGGTHSGDGVNPLTVNGEVGTGSVWRSFLDTWPPSSWPQAYPIGTEVQFDDGGSGTNTVILHPLPLEHRVVTLPATNGLSRCTADTEVKLATGGPFRSTQKNLWVISATATDTATEQPIPYDQISIRGFGNLDTNGNLYVVLPDNDSATITPVVKGNSDYTFSPNAQELKLHINWDNVAGNITGSNVEAVVGQGITLSCDLAGPPGVTVPPITNYYWTVPGSTVTNFYVAPNMSTGMVLTSFPTTNVPASFCWVDGGVKKVQCRATVAGSEILAEATFQVAMPTINWIGQSNNPVRIYTNGANVWLQFGGATNEGLEFPVYGITFTATNRDLSGYGGSYGFIAAQTILQFNVYLAWPSGWHTNITDTGLDTRYPNYDLGTGDGASAGDSPGVGINNVIAASYTASFRTLLLFQPDYQFSVPVPVKEILWNWSGQAVTNGAGGWTLVQSNCFGNITANDRPTSQFPSWTNRVDYTH